MSRPGVVVTVSRSAAHTFSKEPQPQIELVAGHGVEGDAHAGATVKHRSRVALNPHQPNLRQVHLFPAEMLQELRGAGFDLRPGDLGENVMTRDLDLFALPTDTRLHLGDAAIVEVKGLRNPCGQLEHFRAGLMAAVLARDSEGRIVRKAGIMGVVLRGGMVRPGDAIQVELPPGPHLPLEKV